MSNLAIYNNHKQRVRIHYFFFDMNGYKAFMNIDANLGFNGMTAYS